MRIHAPIEGGTEFCAASKAKAKGAECGSSALLPASITPPSQTPSYYPIHDSISTFLNRDRDTPSVLRRFKRAHLQPLKMQPILVAILLVGLTLLISFYRKLYDARTVFIRMRKRGVVSSHVFEKISLS
jgi:hypothetical protein